MNRTIVAIEIGTERIAWGPGTVESERVTAEGRSSWGTETRLTFDAAAGSHRIGQTINVTIESETV